MEEDLPIAVRAGVNRIALPSFVLGYHGCDHEVAERVLAGAENLLPSRNENDWLGGGIYFWEHNPARAEEWARERCVRRGRGSPAVIGAVIDLANCFNLLDTSCIRYLDRAYRRLASSVSVTGEKLPGNRSSGSRMLDCLVVEAAASDFDSVRAVFVEGAPIYPGAGFHEKSHIQICVREPARIVGVFRVRTRSSAAYAGSRGRP